MRSFSAIDYLKISNSYSFVKSISVIIQLRSKVGEALPVSGFPTLRAVIRKDFPLQRDGDPWEKKEKKAALRSWNFRSRPSLSSYFFLLLVILPCSP